jgi:kynurenine formamidase
MDATSNGSSSRVARRDILTLLTGLAAVGAAAQAQAASVQPSEGRLSLQGRTLQVVDMTQELTSDFNVSPPNTRISMHPIVGSGEAVGMKLNLLSLVEHTGTHIDAPRHFSDTGASLGEIPIQDLVVPLAIIDIRARVAHDRDAALTPDDILAWEAKHGRLPDGCCVAMNAGWDPLAERRRAASLGPVEGHKAPGFSPEAAAMLMAQRRVKGIAVDALSIDKGTNGPAYPVHQAWLRSGRWGIEGLTNMDQVPASGAILVVGAPPIKDATGMPIRAIAIF